LKETGNVKTLQDLRSDFRIPITFLDYHRLINAVPQSWLDKMSAQQSPHSTFIPLQLRAILVVKKVCSAYSNVFEKYVKGILSSSQKKIET
jgi:hypothetical protein